MKLNETSRKFRIAVVLSAIWLVGVCASAVDTSPRTIFALFYNGYNSWQSYCAFIIENGVLPLLVLWGIIWICAASNRK
jgi:hypothetical protein